MPIIDSNAIAVFERPVTAPKSVGKTGAPSESSAPTTAPKASFADIVAQAVDNSSRAVSETVEKPLKAFKFWEKDSLSFGDVIDIVNPLQHLPIVSTFYRNLTGDQIGAAPRLIGGALWGRVGGLLAGAVNAVVEFFTGKDVGDHLYSAFFGPPKAPPAALLAQTPNAPAVNEKSVAPSATAADTLIIANPPAQLVPVQEREIVESTLRSSDEKPNAVPETSESKEIPVIDETPWSAASALHIFQSHDRALKRDEETPVLRYVA